MAKTKPKNQRSKRTSIWLDNTLRARLDQRAEKEGRSLAQTIEFYLKQGLGKSPAQPKGADAAETVFG